MPKQARKILPSFRQILDNASESDLESPSFLWLNRVSIIHSRMEEDKFSCILKFLGVSYVPYLWYSHCILCSSGWLENISKELYVHLLCFLA